MAKSDYRYAIKPRGLKRVILIEDLCLGRMTVTNDIENVVAEIAEQTTIDPALYMIVYKDSDGIWNGWDHKTQQFVHLGTRGWKSAVLLYSEKQLPLNTQNKNNG